MYLRPYQICSRCVMDTSDKEIVFDAFGVCNHCHAYTEKIASRIHVGEKAKEMLQNLVKSIKKSGEKSEYDCIIGVSGGVDSTYVAYLVKKLGLKPLAIHFDNGWNSELAVSNIEKTLKTLDIDLYTYVIDWSEFRDLQISFLNASTPDAEIPTDHAINALLFQEASKRNIKYIINGMNFASESMNVPTWSYGHSDWKYIKAVHNRFGSVKLKNYPHFSFIYLFYITFIKRIKVISILNYIDFKKDHAMEIIKNELGWVYYGGKHHESVYTRFFQSYILPVKFNIDKRKAHLSDLIKSGQLKREEALQALTLEICPKDVIETDKEFVIKKLKMQQEKFDKIMSLPLKTFRDYPNSYIGVQRLKKIVNILRKMDLYSK